MSHILDRNLEALAKKHPRIVERITRMDHSDARRCFVNPRNVPVVQYQRDGRWFHLTSAYDPVAEAEQQLRNVENVAEAKLIIVLGEGGLFHAEAALKQSSADALILLISNRFDHLRVALECRDLIHVLEDERFRIIADDEPVRIKGTVQAFIQRDHYTIPTFAIVEHPVEARLQQDFFFDMKKFLVSAFTTSLVNMNTTVFFEHWWSRNMLRNLPHMLTSVPLTQMQGTWKDKPAIIVGAGPSLNKNIHVLKEAKGRALIICVDTAYRILQRNGIVPDLLITLDGSPMNAEHMRNCDYSSVPLLFDPYSHYEILAHHHGPRILLSSVEFHKQWWERVFKKEMTSFGVAHGGSVATAAFSFARFIGADPVILTGIDLSYPNGQCYANGALHDARKIEEMDRKLYPVKDIYGEDTYTTFDYMYYLKWFQQQVENHADRTYINATEGGALTGNFLIQRLEEVLDQYCAEPVPVNDWMKIIQRVPVEPAFVDEVRNNLARSRSELRAMVRYLKIMLHHLNAYAEKLQQRDFDKLGEQLTIVSKGNRKLSELSLALSFMDSHSFEAIYKDIRLSESIQRDSDDYTQMERTLLSTWQSVNLYGELHKIATESVAMHNEALKDFDTIFHRELRG